MFVDRLPPTTPAAERLGAKGCSKRVSVWHRSYHVSSVDLSYLKILQENVEDSVIISHATRVTKEGGVPDQPLQRTGEQEEISSQPVIVLQSKNRDQYPLND